MFHSSATGGPGILILTQKSFRYDDDGRTKPLDSHSPNMCVFLNACVRMLHMFICLSMWVGGMRLSFGHHEDPPHLLSLGRDGGDPVCIKN